VEDSNSLTVTALLLAVANLSAATRYVSLESTNPSPPYATWATAAANIQQAVGESGAGDVVVVANGEYAGGAAVTNPLSLRSVNGPQFTVINGGGTNQCVSLTNGASVTGFTVPNGWSWGSAGGVTCASTNAFVTNCVIVGNSTGSARGGGASGGTLYNCTVSRNEAGSCGGASLSTLYNCTLTGNSTSVDRGDGGGAYYSTLYNCTLAGNFAEGYGGYGGGASWSALYNCIVCFNTGRDEANYYDGCTLNYCCTAPLPLIGVGNITNDPLFVDYANGNLRLQSNSPCINAGKSAYVTNATDLDGRPRIVGGKVDMGACEFQPGVSGAFIGWLQQYGLPTDGSADYADPDHDGMNNWQEWVCGTNPTNALSVLQMLSATPHGSNVTLTWASVAGVNYFLQRSTDLRSPFGLLTTNILGQAGTTIYADTNAAGAGPFFYRVGVQAQ
jgi:hypothetical protein